jgi:hypothetical protein
MDNSNVAPNWFRLHEAVEDLTILEQIAEPHQCNHAKELRDKITKCRDLKAKLEQDESELKHEYMALLGERNLYAGQAQALEELGNKFDWEPEMLRKIKFAIDDTRRRIREKTRTQGA